VIWWHWPVGLVEFWAAYWLTSRLFTRKRLRGLRETIWGHLRWIGDQITADALGGLDLQRNIVQAMEEQLRHTREELESSLSDMNRWQSKVEKYERWIAKDQYPNGTPGYRYW
jgi:hypothetical protein